MHSFNQERWGIASTNHPPSQERSQFALERLVEDGGQQGVQFGRGLGLQPLQPLYLRRYFFEYPLLLFDLGSSVKGSMNFSCVFWDTSVVARPPGFQSTCRQVTRIPYGP